MDDLGESGGGPPVLPHDGEDDAELLEREDVSPDGIFVDQEEDEFAESPNPECATREQEPSPGSSRETPMFIHDDEHAEEAQPEGLEDSQPPEAESASDHDEDAREDENDEIEHYSDNGSDEGEPCTRACQQQAIQRERKIIKQAKIITIKEQLIEQLRAQLRAARTENRQLRHQLRQLTGSEPGSASPDRDMEWQERLRDCLASGDNDGPSYHTVWKESCRSLNMSIDPNMCHPQIRFKSHDVDEEVFPRQSSPDDLASIMSDEEIRPPAPPLPDKIVFQILKELLTFDGKLIHCFSRLDPHCRPDEFPSAQDLSNRSTGLRGRFFLTSEPRSYISLTHDTVDPNMILAPLCTRKTSGQPNYRLTRSMRSTLGMDYIYQLRGLHFVHFYCLDKEMNNPDRRQAAIRDRSFVADVERATTQAKVPARLESSSLENLDPLFPVVGQRWMPSPGDFDRVRHLFQENTGWDVRVNDLDFDATSSQGTLNDSEADYSETEAGDSEEDDSDSSGSPPSSPPGSRTRRPFTPAPGADFGEEEEHSETEGESHHSGSDNDNDSDASLETVKQRRVQQYLRKAQSEGVAGSQTSIEQVREIIELSSGDEEGGNTAGPRVKTRSVSGIFVTPNPGERSTGTPDTRRRSTSAIQQRRTSSAPRTASSLHNPIDLTQGDSDKEGEGQEATAADEPGRATSAPLSTGMKRNRSPPSEDGGEPKRQKPAARNGSVPLALKQNWRFPA
ncbi:hypothetical protein DHEL01_v203466 [Diaporthe helianthi]|uniref:Uncharacterized protein n=1 Tax=Diaporthe helianthi TaxID=158607 RepID=A0A2P5I6J8_DIAHE|nr:hypothetical protein DHEL01_v203466 [Diaporthe helianthi]